MIPFFLCILCSILCLSPVLLLESIEYFFSNEQRKKEIRDVFKRLSNGFRLPRSQVVDNQ